MATYTFTLRSGGGTLADAKVTYQSTAYDIDDALAAGSGTITTTDDGLASVLRQVQRSDGALLLVEGGTTPGGTGPDRKSNVPLFVQADEPLARPYLWEKTSGGTPTGVRQYHDGTSPYVVGSGSAIKRVSASGVSKHPATVIAAGSFVLQNNRKKFVPPAAGYGIELMWEADYGVGEQLPAGTSYTIRASVDESPTTPIAAFSADGNRDITIVPGGIGKLYVFGDFAAGVPLWVRTRVLCTTAEGIPETDLAIAADVEYSSTVASGTTDNTLATSLATNGNTMWAPSSITIMPYAKIASILGLGDSIMAGKGDPLLTNGDKAASAGFMRRGLSTDGSGGYSLAKPLQIVAQSSETAQNYALQAKRRNRFAIAQAANPTHVECNLGINDLIASRTLAQLQADVLAIATIWTNRGAKYRHCTLTPLTTSTDTWITTAGQTIAVGAARVNFNNWLRDGAPIDATTKAAVATGTSSNVLRAGATGHPMVGYREIADTVESARDSTLWKAPERVVADAAITSAAATLTSATAAFTSADVGKGVTVLGAGAAGAALTTYITAYTNATTVTVAANAGTTVTGASAGIGVYVQDGTHPAPTATKAMAAPLIADQANYTVS